MAGTYPAIAVSFAPGIAASDVPAPSDWLDITDKVQEVDITTGRRDEFSQPGAGTFNVTLDNSDGRFDPDNVSGPYYPNLLPLVWFRVKGGATAANNDVFYGQVSIEGWRLAASQFAGRMITQVTVVDMLEQLANTDLPESVWAYEVRPDVPVGWWRLGESSGAAAVDSSGNGRHGTYEGGATSNSRAGLVARSSDNAVAFDGVDDLMTTPKLPLPGSFTIETWMQIPAGMSAQRTLIRGDSASAGVSVDIVPGDSLGVRFVVSSGGGAFRYVGFPCDDGVARHYVFRYDTATGAATIMVDGVAATGVGIAAAGLALGGVALTVGNYVLSPVAGGVTIDELVVYDYLLSDARVTAHYSAGTEPWGGDLSSERITKLLDAAGFPV